ncbi:MAG TPA: hypothetical protein VFZ61_03775 [Polyangiales bacterium]
MHGGNPTVELNARLSRLLAGEDYTEAAEQAAANLGDYVPLRFDAPPTWLGSAIEQARELGRSGNLNAARNVLANILGTHDQRVQLGAYREHVTWVERQNARRLSGLAWVWRTLYAAQRTSPTVERDRLIERVERFAHDVWQVDGLHFQRNEAERATRAEYVLPTAWRAA